MALLLHSKLGLSTRSTHSVHPRVPLTIKPVARLAHRAQRQHKLTVNAGLFDFLTPKPAAPSFDVRAAELSEALIELTSGSDAGSKVTAEAKEQIAQVAAELSKYCIKNPVRSPLLWGEYEVLYSSKPSAVGGPLRTGFGQSVFPGQVARQILTEPNQLVNQVTFKTLGFVPGYSRQYGEIKPINADTFLLSISRGELKAGLGGVQQKEFNIERQIQILYLDQTLRVVRFIPSAELEDSESDGAEEDILFVFKRIAVEEEAEDEPAADDDDEDEAPKGTFIFGNRKSQSAATLAERQVRKQIEEESKRGGTSKVSATSKVAVAKPATRRGRQQEEEEEEDPREVRRRQAEEAKAQRAAEAEQARVQKEKEQEQARRAKEAEEARRAKEQEAEERQAQIRAAKERAEAEKAAEREKQAAIRELLAQLGEELKEKQAEAKEALKELRDLERSNASSLKEVLAARSAIESAESETAGIAEGLAKASQVKKEAENGVKEALSVVQAAERALKQKQSEVLTAGRK